MWLHTGGGGGYIMIIERTALPVCVVQQFTCINKAITIIFFSIKNKS